MWFTVPPGICWVKYKGVTCGDGFALTLDGDVGCETFTGCDKSDYKLRFLIIDFPSPPTSVVFVYNGPTKCLIFIRCLSYILCIKKAWWVVTRFMWCGSETVNGFFILRRMPRTKHWQMAAHPLLLSASSLWMDVPLWADWATIKTLFALTVKCNWKLSLLALHYVQVYVVWGWPGRH